jgi:AraC-like DNA-binding protein
MTQVSIMAIRALVGAVEGLGVPRARYLAEAGMSEAQLDDRSLRVPISDYDRARRAALNLSGDPGLGLRMGRSANIAAYDVLGQLAEHSGTLRNGLQAVTRYARIVMEGPELAIHEEGDVATLRYDHLEGEAPEMRLSAEFVVSSLLYLVRRFVGESVLPRKAFFTHASPAHSEQYTAMFGGRERFSQPFTGIEIDRAWLDRSHAYGSPELCTFLMARADMLLARVDQDAPVAERLRRFLSSQDLQTKPTMDTVARELGMSARSLRRRLQEEHAIFNDLVEDARALHAKRMLSDPRLSVQEAAYALGFGTPAAFTRAFKRWTGVAPTTFRSAR